MDIRINRRNATALALFLAAGPATFAQILTGSLSGSVKDRSGAPVAGARVIITSPQLMGAKETVSAPSGEWRMPLLPPGYYKVMVSKEGMVSAGAENIRVGAGANARQDLVLKSMQKAQAVVEVVATSATVDKSDPKVASNFSAENLATLPVADRSFSGALNLAPGVTPGNSGASSIRGGTTQSTSYSVNGADVRDPYEGRITGNFLIEDNVEDVQVVLSPLHARNGRSMSGGVNVVTKSGGNEFAGSIRATLTKDSWNAKGRAGALDEGSTTDDLQREYQVTFSGPIIKDRIWFSVGTILTPSFQMSDNLGDPFTSSAKAVLISGQPQIDNVLLNGPAGYQWTRFDANKSFTYKKDAEYYEGKITGAITPDHTLEFAYTHSHSELFRNPFGKPVPLRLAMLGKEWQDKNSYAFNYRGMLSGTTFLEARYSKVDSASQFPPGDPAYCTGETMMVNAGNGVDIGRVGRGYPFGMQGCPYPERRNNRDAGLNLKMFRDLAGNHEIDLGIQYYEAQLGSATKMGNNNMFAYVGGAYERTGSSGDQYLFPTVIFNGVGQYGTTSLYRGPAPTLERYVGADGTTKTKTQSAYLNDTWTINSHWNLMVGLRCDKLFVYDSDGAKLAQKTDFSPRIQVKYDVFGDSKHLVTATAARYQGDFGIGFVSNFAKKADSRSALFGWSGIGNQPALPVYDYKTSPVPALPAGFDNGQYGVRFVTYAQIMDPQYYTIPLDFADSSQNFIIDPNLKAPYSDELTLGYRRSWDNGTFVRATWVNKRFKNDWAYVVDYLPSMWTTVNNPLLANPDPNDALLIQQQYVTNSKKMKREYNALELEWNARLSSVWTFGGNWTYSRLVGNSNGGDQAGGGQAFRDNAVEGVHSNAYWKNKLGISESYYAPEGLLNQHLEHRGRIYLTAELPLGKGRISYSWMLRYQSGSPWNIASAAPFGNGTNIPETGPESSYPTTYTRFFGGRGQFTQNDRYYTDFKLAFNVPLGISRLMLIGDLMVNNLFNHQQLVAPSHAQGGVAPTGSDNFFLGAAFGSAPQHMSLYYGDARNIQTSLGLRF